MEPLPQAIGELLRGYRARSGITQQELAARAGVSVRALRDLEHDRVRRPHDRALRALAEALALTSAEREDLRHALAGQEPGAPDRRLRVDVLGPLAVRRGGQPVDVGPVMQRLLLGLLALQPRQPVSVDEIVETLWPGRPPRTHLGLVHSYVARLRQRVEAHQYGRAGRFIASVRGGYRLDLPPDQLDVARFEKLLREAWRARDRGDLAGALGSFAAALHCWRGRPAADLGPVLLQHPATAALSRARLAATLAFADLSIHNRQYEPAALVLQELAEPEPLHEGLYARLILALAGAGQQVAALRMFDDIRARLMEELGMAPGHELAAAHLRVLRQELPAPQAAAALGSAVTGVGRGGPVAVPAQLPPDVPDFTGREPELQRLTALVSTRPVAGCPAETALPIAIVTGPPGVGKTALAVHWAHRIAGSYPDGQLYVDLRGYAPDPPLRPIDALRHLLTGCGVAVDDLPPDLQAGSSLLRSVLAGRRMLVVLDNAGSAEQVRPLLPGKAGCLVLVTSRDRLDGLVARNGARRIGLPALTDQESLSLLANVVGPERVAAEPAAAAELVTLCGRLPLALRIAAAHLTGARTTVAGYAAELRDSQRITQLAVAGDEQSAGVEMAFQHSYARLSASHRRLFRMIGLAPGADFTVDDAASLCDLPRRQAEAGLAQLDQAHLVERVDHHRYRLHDLIRCYADYRSQAEDASPERDAALLRLIRGYAAAAAAAARLLYPQLLLLVPAEAAAGEDRFPDHAAALAWLEAERPNLLAAVRAAAARPWPEAGHLAYAVRGFLEHRRHLDDLIEVSRAALAVSTATGDGRGEASARMSLAIAYGSRGDYDSAREGFTAALASARRHGWLDIETSAHTNLGVMHSHLGQLDHAADHYRVALVLDRRSGWQIGQGAALTSLAAVYYRRGRVAEAVRHLTEARELADWAGAVGVAARARQGLGQAYHLFAQLDTAAHHLTAALDRFRQVGNRSGEAGVLQLLAAVRLDAGDLDRAGELAEAALGIARDWTDGNVEIDVHNTLGELYLRRGTARRAAAEYADALALAVARGQRFGEVEALIGVARAQTALGQVAAGLADARRALSRAHQRGYLVLEGRTGTALAHIYAGYDRIEPARRHLERALRRHRQTGDRLGETQSLLLFEQLRGRADG